MLFLFLEVCPEVRQGNLDFEFIYLSGSGHRHKIGLPCVQINIRDHIVVTLLQQIWDQCLLYGLLGQQDRLSCRSDNTSLYDDFVNVLDV
jgi:hypothetical protein